MKYKKNCDINPVHWYSKEEWEKVYKLIFGSKNGNKDKKEALQILLVWKSRNPYLPSAIESTLSLLEVDLQYPIENVSNVNDRLLRHMYSSAIMRFINHTLDDAQSKKVTLLQAAVQMDIPQWIINLRHETAHGHELPSLNIFKKATEFAINWLHYAYWQPYNQEISNCVVRNNTEVFHDDTYNLLNLIGIFILCQYYNFKIKKMHDISDIILRKNLIDDLRTILEKKIDENSFIYEISIKLLEIIENYSENNKRNSGYSEIFTKVLLDSESIFMSCDIICVLGISKTNIIPQRWLYLWEPLLKIIYCKNISSTLINQLIDLIMNENESNVRKELAANWLKKIFSDFNKINSRESLMNLSVQIPTDCIPHNVRSLDFIQNTLKKTNPFLHIYANELMQLSDVHIDEETKNKLNLLVDIMTGNSLKTIPSDNVYTVNDVKIQENINNPDNLNVCEQSDTKNNGHNEKNSVWKRCDDNCEWGKYPIGMLPWQNDIVMNPLLL